MGSVRVMAPLIPNSVLPDANIWVSQTLHSWFCLIAAETRGSWRFYWTEDILAEAVYHRRRGFVETGSKQVEDLRDRLIKTMGENRISGFPYDYSVTFPDENDAHIHNAAVHAGIAIIVSDNVRDLEGIYSNPDDCPYEVHTADEFLMLVAQSSPRVVDAVTCLQHDYHAGKRKQFSLPKKLNQAGCSEFAHHVQQRLQDLF